MTLSPLAKISTATEVLPKGRGRFTDPQAGADINEVLERVKEGMGGGVAVDEVFDWVEGMDGGAAVEATEAATAVKTEQPEQAPNAASFWNGLMKVEHEQRLADAEAALGKVTSYPGWSTCPPPPSLPALSLHEASFFCVSC